MLSISEALLSKLVDFPDGGLIKCPRTSVGEVGAEFAKRMLSLKEEEKREHGSGDRVLLRREDLRISSRLTRVAIVSRV